MGMLRNRNDRCSSEWKTDFMSSGLARGTGEVSKVDDDRQTGLPRGSDLVLDLNGRSTSEGETRDVGGAGKR